MIIHRSYTGNGFVESEAKPDAQHETIHRWWTSDEDQTVFEQFDDVPFGVSVTEHNETVS